MCTTHVISCVLQVKILAILSNMDYNPTFGFLKKATIKWSIFCFLLNLSIFNFFQSLVFLDFVGLLFFRVFFALVAISSLEDIISYIFCQGLWAISSLEDMETGGVALSLIIRLVLGKFHTRQGGFQSLDVPTTMVS